MSNESRSQSLDRIEANGASLPLTGTESQIEWAVRIQRSVAGEFDRVANAFRKIAAQKPSAEQLDIEAVIAILEDKRTEVMARRDAGYFIQNWQELRDQVREMIAADPRYQVIKTRRGRGGSLLSPF